jgi:chaperonin GroES
MGLEDGFEDDYEAEAPDMMVEGEDEEAAPLARLAEIARVQGDISDLLTPQQLVTIGTKVCEDYERDKASRADWTKTVEDALKKAAQESKEDKSYPFENCSNVSYPLLTVAALQFNARAYPAVVKGDEAVTVKVIGKDREGSKAKKAQRVREYLNYLLFYKIKGWEADTDQLLLQLPIVGCVFRKVWTHEGLPCSAMVPALRLFVPMDAKDLETTPRITEEVPDVYPYQIRQRVRSGQYREVTLPTNGDDDEAPRLLLEQHRFLDLDEDGVDEPYIVTVDCETKEVLSVQANFTAEDALSKPELKRRAYYVKYGFFPHPEGKFYDIGFGHLLEQLSAVIDTAINQLNDAGHAQIAGGGFIAAGLRLQGAGQTSNLKWKPGEYKVVSSGGQDLRAAVYERTFPNPSPVTFQLLDMMLGAAKDIAAIKDVLTGDTPGNNAAVGTTLALIEQGLQVFTAIYKRVYRALKDEFGLMYENLADYASDEARKEYLKVLDDPEADFNADFSAGEMDIRPVSDPQSVTRSQKMARAQFLLGLKGQGLNDMEINRRVLEAADIEDIDKLMPDPNKAGPPPGAVEELEKTKSETAKNMATAEKTAVETQILAHDAAFRQGMMHGSLEGGVSGMEGPSDQSMGLQGNPDGEQPPESGMAGAVMGAGDEQPPFIGGIEDAG